MSPTPESIAKMHAGAAAAREARKVGNRPRPTTPLRAIRAMCRDCIYDPLGDGRWTDQIAACTSPDCPLYGFRLRALPVASRPRGANGANPTVNGPCLPSQRVDSQDGRMVTGNAHVGDLPTAEAMPGGES